MDNHKNIKSCKTHFQQGGEQRAGKIESKQKIPIHYKPTGQTNIYRTFHQTIKRTIHFSQIILVSGPKMAAVYWPLHYLLFHKRLAPSTQWQTQILTYPITENISKVSVYLAIQGLSACIPYYKIAISARFIEKTDTEYKRFQNYCCPSEL